MEGDEVSMDRYEREIHREQIDCDIVAVGVYLCLAIDTNAHSMFPSLEVALEVRESLLLRRFTSRDPPSAFDLPSHRGINLCIPTHDTVRSVTQCPES
jgi:hypothetical protein